MKKITAILLLVLFLFNIVGYKALFLYLSQKADRHIEALIQDATKEDDRFITFKIPLNLPYLPDGNDFETLEGELNVKGTIYKLIKKKISRDTLIVLCINHPEKTRIEKDGNDYFKKVNDLTSDTSKKPESKVKTDYVLQDKLVNVCLIAIFHKTAFSTFVSNSLLKGHYPLITSPPELPVS
ncbi:hypothetical protein GZH53_14865 [Flavihumibacter sp. R14]|nr:hypothetical protein [Flavihumibacter soli]